MFNWLSEHRFALGGAIFGFLITLFSTMGDTVFNVVWDLIAYTVWGAIIGENFARPEKRLGILSVGIGFAIVSFFAAGRNDVDARIFEQLQSAGGAFVLGAILGTAPGLVWQTAKRAIPICTLIGFVVGLGVGVVNPNVNDVRGYFLVIGTFIFVTNLIAVPAWLWFKVAMNKLSPPTR